MQYIPHYGLNNGLYAYGNNAYNGGAYNESISNYRPIMLSVDSAILPNMITANSRTDDIVRNNGYIANAINIYKDQIIGKSYNLRLLPKSEIIFGQKDNNFEQNFTSEVEKLWAHHMHNNTYIDTAGKNTFVDFLRMSVNQWMVRGEFICTVEWLNEPNRPFCTALNAITSERLNDTGIMNEVVDVPVNYYNAKGGIALDSFGKSLGYFIYNRDPFDYLINTVNMNNYFPETKFVPSLNDIGRKNILHVFEQSKPGQTRGVSRIWTAISEIHMHSSYKEICLTQAAVQSMYAAIITSDLPTSEILEGIGSTTQKTMVDGEEIDVEIPAYQNFLNVYERFNNVKIRGGQIAHLLPGSKMDLVTPGNNNNQVGSDFEKSLLRSIATAIGLSYEQFTKDYSSTNYSSSVASEGVTKKTFEVVKKFIVDKLANEIFILWLEEVINRGLIKTINKISNYDPTTWLYSGDYPRQRLESLANCKWIGTGQIVLDNVKDVTASSMRIATGLSNYTEEMARLGLDFDEQIAQRIYEKKMLEEAGLNFAVPTSVVSMPDDTTNEQGE